MFNVNFIKNFTKQQMHLSKNISIIKKYLKKSEPTCQIIQETTPFTDQRTFHPLPPKHLSPPTHRPQLGAVLPLCYY